MFKVVKMATSSKSSVCSARSGKSTTSSASAAHARARAEAAKVRASYASQEAKLKMEKAAREAQNQLETVRIDTELEVLTLHREADAAAVEAQVLEDAEISMHAAVERGRSESEKVKIECTREYVNSQINLQSHSPSPVLSALPVAPPPHADSHNSFITWSPPVKDISYTQSIYKPKSEKADSMHLPTINLPDLSAGAMKSEVRSPIMNVHAKSYVPQYIPSVSTPPKADPLAQYLARRDLVNSGLYQFDDKPENYRSWYSSFTSAAREVHLTATQELDLMTKWLGKESGEL